MQESSFTLDTADEVPVEVWHWEPDPDRPVVGVVQIAHGLAEHAGRYRWTAARLTDAGWAVVADDHRGHGRTAPSEDDLGFFAARRGWVKVLDDLHRLTRYARELHPDVPVVLLGHSMGSFLAQQYLFTFPRAIEAAILSGSDGPIGPQGEVAAVAARVEQRRLGPHTRSEFLNDQAFGAYNRAFEPTRTDFDWLSRDPDQVDAYIDDPWCGFVATTRLWRDILGGVRVIGQPERLADIPMDLPILIVSGEEDPVGGAVGVANLVAHYEGAGLTAVTSRVYDGGRHEMLNETNRDEVIDDLLTWLHATVLG